MKMWNADAIAMLRARELISTAIIINATGSSRDIFRDERVCYGSH